MKHITVIIVTYLSQEVIQTALTALQPAWTEGFADCIVVDNSPDDATVSVVAEKYPWAFIIKSERNVGYGAGCNLGLRHVRTRHVLFMNPDVVLEYRDLVNLERFLSQNPLAGLAAPAMLQSDGNVQTAGGLLTPWRLLASAIGFEGARAQHPMQPGHDPHLTDWVCGAILAASTEFIREMGGFDPRFFLYFEETDLCRRVRKRQREIWAVNNVVVRHRERSSTQQVTQNFFVGCITEHYFRSRFYYLVKHYGWPLAVATESGELAILACRDMVKRISGKPDAIFHSRWQGPLFKMPLRM